MIFNMVGGGSSNPFAMVLVNYPQNSTLTATNVDGFKDIFPSSSATPQRLYYVSQPSGTTQSCTLAITDGTRTKTYTVSGITIGTAQTIRLTYGFYLYNSGDVCTAITGGYTYKADYQGAVTYNSDNMYVVSICWPGGSGGAGRMHTNSIIAIPSDATKLVVSCSGSGHENRIGLFAQQNDYPTVYRQIDSTGVFNIDISSYAGGDYYFGVHQWGGGWGNQSNMTIYYAYIE